MPDDDRDTHWTWFAAGVLVALALSAKRRGRRAVRRARTVLGARLIDVDASVMPGGPEPPIDPAKRKERAVAAMGKGRTRARRNGCAGKGEAGPI